ncbi:MAG: RsmB/NOP family class I SAM-dependent RNA methyltransferase [Nanoarchaeota archaeon]|nr:RsmB/NOP family class I SAM-dependent RNA methyltransferase [Nanoarchaeota archaeon]
MTFPKPFIERYNSLVDDPEAFFRALETPLPKSFRVNPLKGNRNQIRTQFEQYGFGITSVPWYEDAFVSDTPNIGATIEHFTGQIYIQELASMLPPLAIRNDLKYGKLLDLAAAPGSKTTQAACLMNNRGVILANDSDYLRTSALRFNIEKQGVVNTVVTNFDARTLRLPEPFPVVLLDAPCSSEGTIRKNPAVLRQWSERLIQTVSTLQKQLITNAYNLTAPGGVLLYSTCTFAPEENEGVVQQLLDTTEATLERVRFQSLQTSPGIEAWRGTPFPGLKHAIRVWPHRTNTDGFFLAKIRKP